MFCWDQWFINVIACMSDMQPFSNVDHGPKDATQLRWQPYYRSTPLWGRPTAGQVRGCTKLQAFGNGIFFYPWGSLFILLVNRCWLCLFIVCSCLSFFLLIWVKKNLIQIKILHRFNLAWISREKIWSKTYGGKHSLCKWSSGCFLHIIIN